MRFEKVLNHSSTHKMKAILTTPLAMTEFTDTPDNQGSTAIWIWSPYIHSKYGL